MIRTASNTIALAAPTGTATTPRILRSQILTAPLVVVTASFAAFFALGAAGVPPFDNWPMPARGALAAMFLFTAAARLTPARADLVAMVPRWLPWPGALVAVTGVLEAAGASGLLVPVTATPAAWCLAGLLVALFPANVHAAQAGVGMRGGAPAPIRVRLAQQAVYLGLAVVAATM